MAKEIDMVARLASGMHFQVMTEKGYQIDLDMADDEGGEEQGPQPMEMLLVGLAGCAGMSNLLILRKRKQDVRQYEIRIHGERADLHPQVFIEITVEHLVTGKGIKPEIMERAMKMTEQKYCGASVMLAKTARIYQTYRLIEAE